MDGRKLGPPTDVDQARNLKTLPAIVGRAFLDVTLPEALDKKVFCIFAVG